MTVYGLTETGFVTKPADVILSEVEAAQRATIDATLDVSAESPVGQINASILPQVAALWPLADAAYKARDPNGATQAQLDALAALTGTQRLQASAGTVRMTLTLAAHTTVPTGTVFAVLGQPANRWQTTAPALNTTGSTMPVANVPCVATQVGTLEALAGTITVIATPVSGLLAATNPHDAVEGRNRETDAELRTRRQAELESAGTSPVDAIRAALVAPAMADIIAAAFVEENATSYTDAFGRPPHTIEAVVQFVPGIAGVEGPDLEAARARVAALLWANKPGGIDTTGDHSTTVQDVLGIDRTVRWTEPQLVPISVLLELSVMPASYVGTTAVQEAILAFGATLTLGQTVVLAKLSAAVVGLDGVEDVDLLELGTTGLAGVLVPQNIGITPRQLAVFDTSRIDLSTLPPTP